MKIGLIAMSCARVIIAVLVLEGCGPKDLSTAPFCAPEAGKPIWTCTPWTGIAPEADDVRYRWYQLRRFDVPPLGIRDEIPSPPPSYQIVK